MRKALTIVKRAAPDAGQRPSIEPPIADADVRYRRLFETVQVGILMLDARSGVITDVNPYLIALLGHSREEFVGRTPTTVDAFATTDGSRNAFAALPRHEHARYEDVQLKAMDDRLIHVEVVSDIYVTDEGRVIQCNIRDLSGHQPAAAASQPFEHHDRDAGMEALHIVGRALRLAQTEEQALPVLIDEALTALDTDAGAIWLHCARSDDLRAVVARGWFRRYENTPLVPGEGIVGTVFSSGQTYTAEELTDRRLVRELTAEHFPVGWAGVCVPIRTGATTIGALAVCLPAPHHVRAEQVKLLESLAEMGGAALHRMRLHEETMQQVDRLFADQQRSTADLAIAYDATIEGWSRALDLRDNATEGHTQRVAETTVRLARAMGLSEADVVHVRRGALLHDIGKISVPDRILLKPGPLTEEEWIVMRTHPKLAYDMLSPVSYLRLALDIPYCHHERWDGSGYPRGLKGEQIPLAARVFAVVDVWDALRSNRPYRPAWPADTVIEYIRSLAGVHFDPEVVRVFLERRVFDPLVLAERAPVALRSGPVPGQPTVS